MQFASSLLSLQFVLFVRLCSHFVISWIFFRPEVLMVAFVLSIGLLLGLMFKRKEHPTNMYLLLAFVSLFYLSYKWSVDCSLAILNYCSSGRRLPSHWSIVLKAQVHLLRESSKWNRIRLLKNLLCSHWWHSVTLVNLLYCLNYDEVLSKLYLFTWNQEY